MSAKAVGASQGPALAGNLLAGWLMAWLITRAFPGLRHTAVEAGTHYATLGVNLRSFAFNARRSGDQADDAAQRTGPPLTTTHYGRASGFCARAVRLTDPDRVGFLDSGSYFA